MTRCPTRSASLGDDQRVYLGALELAAETRRPGDGHGLAGPPVLCRRRRPDCRPAGRSGRIYLAFLGRTNGPRAGWLLASLDPAFVLKRLREAAGWERPNRTRRELPAESRKEPEGRHERRRGPPPRGAGTDPPGRDRQGRGPVPRRRGIGGRRTAPAAAQRRRSPEGRAQHRIEAGRRGDPRRRAAGRPGGRRAAPGFDRGRRADHGDRRRTARASRRRSRTCCCASRIRPIRTCRSAARRPTSPSGPGASACPRRPSSPTIAGDRKPHWELGDQPRHVRSRARRQGRGLGLPGVSRRGFGPPARPDRLLPRHPHPRERDDRDLAAGRGQHGVGASAPARSRTRKTRCTSSRATTCT